MGLLISENKSPRQEARLTLSLTYCFLENKLYTGMTKILVTTDLSKNSKAGIRFAIQLASQRPLSLIFYQVIDVPKPTQWNDEKYNDLVKMQLKNAEIKLNRFVNAVYKQTGRRPGKYKCVVKTGILIGRDIIDYALKIRADFICMGTRGAGRIRRIMGTHTSSVLTHSPIPVLVIPKNYRRIPISHVLYSTDLDSLGSELKKVKKFADPIKARLSVLHYDYLYNLEEAQAKLNKIARKYQTHRIKFHFQKLQIEDALVKHLKKAIRKFKPSLVVLFTKQDRDWYERLFLSSKSAEASFDTTKPLLTFTKK